MRLGKIGMFVAAVVIIFGDAIIKLMLQNVLQILNFLIMYTLWLFIYFDFEPNHQYDKNGRKIQPVLDLLLEDQAENQIG